MFSRPFNRSAFSEQTAKESESGFLFGKAFTLIVIAIILLWLYAPSLHFHFWYDDYTHLFESSVASWDDIVSNFHPVQPGWAAGELLPFYRPLSHRNYFGLMRLIFGLDPLYYHCVCLVLLSLISFNIYLMTSFLGKDRLAGFIASVLFATGTSTAVSQLWVSVTPDLLVVFLMLTSFSMYILSTQRASAVYRASSAVVFILALLAKEAAIVLPGMLLLAELLYARPGNKEEIKKLAIRLVPFALIAVAYLVFRVAFFKLPKSGPYGVSFGLFALQNLGRYLLIAMNDFLAGFLNVPYIDILHKASIPQATNWWAAWGKFLLVAGAAIFLVWRQKWDLRRDIIFSIGWFVMGLLPILFLPNHFYLYYLLPASPGLALLVGRLLGKSARALHARSPRLAFALCLLVYAIILTRSTLVIRKEQAVLGLASLGMRSIEEQLVYKVPAPPNYSSFIFSGDYYAGWWRNLTPAIRIIYDNSTLNAADIEEEDLLEKAMRSPTPVYLVHVKDGLVHVSRKK